MACSNASGWGGDAMDWHTRLSAALRGKPDLVLSLMLIAAAVVLVLLAIFAHPLIKAAALAWVLLP